MGIKMPLLYDNASAWQFLIMFLFGKIKCQDISSHTIITVLL